MPPDNANYTPAAMTSMYDTMRRAVHRPSFWAILSCCILVYALVWWLDLTDDLLSSITLTVLVTVMLALDFPAAPAMRQWQGQLLWFAVFLAGGVVLLASKRFEIGALAANSAVALILLPPWLLAWWLMGRNWFLMTGVALAAAVMMVYWTVALTKSGDKPWDLILLPFTVVVLVAVFWSPLALLCLTWAVRRKNRRLAGPGSQALLMSWLFIPTIVVAIFVPSMLGLPDIWTAVSLTLTGFILSTVVSEPLRRFLVRWGDLDP